MSAGGTTTVVTPAPRSAASALSEAIAKEQAATAPVQTSAQSESLEGTAPDAPADHSGRAGQVRLQPQLLRMTTSSPFDMTCVALSDDSMFRL